MIKKIEKKLNKISENYHNKLLLKKIKYIDIKNSDYLYVFNPVNSKFTRKLYFLIAYELSKNGFPSIFLRKDDSFGSNFPELKIDDTKISNSCVFDKRFTLKTNTDNNLNYEWEIDLDNKTIKVDGVDGIDFYPLISNTLRTIQKCYNISLETKEDHIVLDKLVCTSDLIIKYFFLLKKFANKHNKKIRFVTYEVGYVPNGVFRVLCDLYSENRDMECIELRRGYKSYFGKHDPKESFILCTNLTKNHIETGLLISEREWRLKDSTRVQSENIKVSISNAIKKKIYDNAPVSQNSAVKKIRKYKDQGKNIFVLFSHVFYDTPGDDSSASFENMCDWIFQTVDNFKGKDDLLLLKPHPAELIMDQPQKKPNETLAILLEKINLPKNVLLLDTHQFSINDLANYISCGLIWRSSVAMELVFLGIPCIIAGDPIYRTLKLNYAKNKKHYFQMIENSTSLKITEKQQNDVATYLHMLENKHVYIESIKYNKIKKFHWNGKVLRKYLKYGDEGVKKIANQMLE